MSNVLVNIVIVGLFFIMTQAHADNKQQIILPTTNPETFQTTESVNTIVNVGGLATLGSVEAMLRWQPTLSWLQNQIPNTEFRLHPYSLPEIESAVKQQSVDLIITNPGQAVSLGRQYSLSGMATLISQRGDGTHVIGSALIVRADSKYQHVLDVSTLKMAAVANNAFGGYLAMELEIQKKGINSATFFEHVSFLGFPIDNIIYQLRDGYFEAAIMPVCQLEKMLEEGVIEPGTLRILGDVSPSNFTCAVSTELYPNWSIAKTSKLSNQLAKQITNALFALPNDHSANIASESLGWNPPISQLSVDQLYRDLDIHPLQRLWWQETIQWVKSNQQWAWAVLFVLLFLTIYHFILEFRFRRNTRKLKATLNNLQDKNAMLAHAQRVAIIGELGSSLAHEINQPLTAILNYSQGGLLRLKKGADTSEIVPALEKIQQQVKRAGDIIQRLRALINKRVIAKSSCDLEVLMSDTLTLLDYDFQQKEISVNRACLGHPCTINADAVGLQQVLLNVLNNASDACLMQQTVHPSNNEVNIESRYDDDQLILTIIDNGIGLTATQAELKNAFFTTKKDGLGLGLAICRDVIEDHNGQFSIQQATPRGCCVSIILPLR